MDELDDAFDAGNRGTSALPNYEADGGKKDFGAKVIVHYTPWQKWGVMGMLSYSSLLNDADSLLVDKEGDDKQMFFGLMATYRWEN